MTAPAFLDVLEELIESVIEPAAADVDASVTFPRAAVTAPGEEGLGIPSATEVAGVGLGLGEAAQGVRRIAASCGSTAIGHVTAARIEHLDQTPGEQPVVRQHVAEVKNLADAASALVDDAVVALATRREDAPAPMLRPKAGAGDTTLAVLDLAMRVCGGAAFRKDIGLERHIGDARAAVVMAPTSDALRDFIGRAVSGLPRFG